MTEYERLEQDAFDQGILINDKILKSDDKLSGLYIDFGNGSFMILINRHREYAQRLTVLREEIAHHQKTVGRIIDQKVVENRKAENIAREHAYKDMLPSIIRALTHGYTTIWDVSEETEIPEVTIGEILSMCERNNIKLHPCF